VHINIVLISLGISQEPSLFVEGTKLLSLLRVMDYPQTNKVGTCLPFLPLFVIVLVPLFSINCASGAIIVTRSTFVLRMSRKGRTGSSPSIHLVVVGVTQMGRQNVLARIVVVVAVVAIVVVPKRITIATVIVVAAEESVLPVPEVPLMIPGHLLLMIVRLIAAIVKVRRLGLMKGDAGLVVLRVLLLLHLQGGPLVAVVAMMPIICLAAVGSLDGSCLGGQIVT
jgi:hypothetical protein